jgi:hypothetical protein
MNKKRKAWNSGTTYSEEFKKVHTFGCPGKLYGKDKEIIAFYLQGNSQLKTGKKFGVTQSGIAYVLKKNKILTNTYIRTGKNNPKWRGGVIYDHGRKLVYTPNHPKPDHSGIYCYEYRLIMEKKLGRYLLGNEIVHHINGDDTDNRIENLAVMTQSNHIAIHRRRGDMKRGCWSE